MLHVQCIWSLNKLFVPFKTGQDSFKGQIPHQRNISEIVYKSCDVTVQRECIQIFKSKMDITAIKPFVSVGQVTLHGKIFKVLTENKRRETFCPWWRSLSSLGSYSQVNGGGGKRIINLTQIRGSTVQVTVQVCGVKAGAKMLDKTLGQSKSRAMSSHWKNKVTLESLGVGLLLLFPVTSPDFLPNLVLGNFHLQVNSAPSYDS